jgi:LysR family nitrogen assimilation transcriptional regulator
VKRFPKVRVFIFEGPNNEVEQKLIEGGLDVALMLSARARIRNITSKRIMSEEMVLATVNDIQAKQSLSISEIADEPLVLARLPNYIRWRVEVAFQRLEIGPKVVAETNSVRMLMELTRRGVGSTILPRSAVMDDVKAGLIKAIPIRGMSVAWTLAISEASSQSQAVKALTQSIGVLLAQVANELK